MIAELKQKNNNKNKLLTYYYCNPCDTDFCLIGEEVVCPACLNTDLKRMVIIYKDYDPTMDEMTTATDWNAGD